MSGRLPPRLYERPTRGSIVTPTHLNDYPRWSVEAQDAWDAEHSPADQEHDDLRVPIAAGIIEMAAGVYSVGASKNIKSVTKNATGDITLLFDVDATTLDEYAVHAVPILASEPFIVKEYDDGATRTATGCQTRLLICDQTKLAKNVALYVRLFGRRAAAMTATGVAVEDVRQRISVDGPETEEHRRLLGEFVDYWSAAMGRKHSHPVRGFGSHFDLLVPRAVAILTPPANPWVNGQGGLVLHGGFSRVTWEQTFGLPTGGQTLPHQIGFELDAVPFYDERDMWHGGGATVRQDTATLASDACVFPRLKRTMRGTRQTDAQEVGAFEFGFAAGNADNVAAIVVVSAFPSSRNP